jgi:hypothetical protein
MKKLLFLAAMALVLSRGAAHAQSAWEANLPSGISVITPTLLDSVLATLSTSKLDVAGIGTTVAPLVNGQVPAQYLANATGGSGSSGGTTAGVITFDGRSGVITLQTGDITAALIDGALGYTPASVSNGTISGATITNSGISGGTIMGATISSPNIIGSPTVPTASAGSDNTLAASTAYVANELANYAPLISPNLSGSPGAPTAPCGTDNNQIATTAFVATCASMTSTSGSSGGSGGTTSTARTATAGIATAGTNLTTAAALTASENEITTCTTGGVALPTGSAAGKEVWIDDRCGSPVTVYPDVAADQIETNGNGTPVTIQANTDNRFVKITSTQWLQ